ncbi:MAG: alanine racemase [Clostridiales bacterium]|nr:alanine racemase [Clostridiales bacterium]MDY4111245.1 alanine racemase [Roseburia sp.]
MEKELVKAAGTLAKDVAEDLVRPTSKSIGENMGLLVDGVMGWLGYWGQKQQIKRAVLLEEYKKQIAKKIAEIPEENLIEPPVRIVGPAIEASKFFIEETTCRKMFAQLIASSCNSAVSGAVHPSFPEIIKQLSPLDARFLLLFKKQSTFPIVELTEKDANGKLTPYYGFTNMFPAVKSLYDTLFHIFSYTRNGIFYVPIFLVMGAWFGHTPQRRKRIYNIYGFLISLLFMIFEGMTLHILDVQRHDSMYLFLLPCMFFLFATVLSIAKQPAPILRSISTWIYLLHPLMIVLIRGIAKLIHGQAILVDNSLIHYIAVCFLSCIFAYIIGKYFKLHKLRYYPKGRAWIELDKKNLYHNISVLKDFLPPGCKFMPAVKANAYGHGAVLISKALNQIGIDSFCVASVSEGIELRKGGVCGEILILGYTHPECFPLLIKYNLVQTVVNYHYAELLNDYGKPVKVHIKIDTGMHRLGERAEHIEEIARMFQMKNLIIEGAFTHLCADESTSPKDRTFTEAQGKAFYQVISVLKEQGYSCPKVHLLASYGLINYPELSGDYARIGIALYGVLSNRSDIQKCKIPLLPVLSIKARIAAIKDLLCGEGVGYGLSYTATENRKIAILPIGYADGIPRALSCGNGNVLINGSIATLPP